MCQGGGISRENATDMDSLATIYPPFKICSMFDNKKQPLPGDI